jgi:hypothetical protein
MGGSTSGRTDLPVLILSIIAVILAGVMSLATITSKSDKNVIYTSNIPSEIADEAARAGVNAAKWHIECHGRTVAGGLSSRYYVNGAIYSVKWGDVNLRDSIVDIKSVGSFASGPGQIYRSILESKIKIDFLPAHRNTILTTYYSENWPDLIDSIPQ